MADTFSSAAAYVTATMANNNSGNASSGNFSFHEEKWAPNSPKFWTILFSTFYGVICFLGIVGNGLVIFVVIRYTKMKTVTNMYILNLAIADICFVIGLPFLIITMVTERWLFGYHMCKVFYLLTSINWFTSVFTLTVMSADRYMAVCHPVRSMRYRTPLVSRVVCICVWLVSLLVMLPIVLYATTTGEADSASCTIQWPRGQAIAPDKAFIWYALLHGFAIPVSLISVFYTLVVLRLKTVGPKNKSKEKKKTHRKVTKMVLTVIAVYVVCWLPYWVFQVTLTFVTEDPPRWSVPVFQMITVLSYANSILNPLVYAFLSENFRKAFIKAFSCAAVTDVNRTLNAEQSTFPGRRRPGGGGAGGGGGGGGAGGCDTQSGGTKTRLTTANSEEEVEITPATEPTFAGAAPYKSSPVSITAKFEKDSDGVHVVVTQNGGGTGADPPPVAV